MKILNVFDYADLERSNVALLRGIDNKIPFELLENADLVIGFLSRLFWHLSDVNLSPVALRVTSGYRCQLLNKYVGGVSNSDHTSALAVDITHNRLNDVYDILRTEKTFKECIRYMEINPKRNYIHVSLKPVKLPF